MKPFLATVFIVAYFSVAALAGAALFGPLLAKAPKRKLSIFLVAWAIIITLTAFASYTGGRYLRSDAPGAAMTTGMTIGWFVLMIVSGLLRSFSLRKRDEASVEEPELSSRP